MASESKGDQYEIQDKHKWAGQELGVNSDVPLVDSGQGKPYIIRQFEFAFNPQVIKNKTIVDKQALFNQHWHQLRVLLWGDGLVACEDIEPRVLLGKKRYKIILLCEPRLGVMIAEKPNTLQQITPASKNH